MQFNERNNILVVFFFLLKQNLEGYFDVIDRIDNKIIPCSCSMSVQAILDP